jgi:L-ascorbate metabolism protein UlaG (beta-lactamase superfamily)
MRGHAAGRPRLDRGGVLDSEPAGAWVEAPRDVLDASELDADLVIVERRYALTGRAEVPTGAVPSGPAHLQLRSCGGPRGTGPLRYSTARSRSSVISSTANTDQNAPSSRLLATLRAEDTGRGSPPPRRATGPAHDRNPRHDRRDSLHSRRRSPPGVALQSVQPESGWAAGDPKRGSADPRPMRKRVDIGGTVKISRYRQSCLVVEADNGARLLLDAGFHTTETRRLQELGTIDAAFYTHEHRDHFDQAWVGPLLELGVPIYANREVCEMIGEGATPVQDGASFLAAEVTVRAHELAHMPMVDGSPGPPNLGFLIDGRLLHPGDARNIGGLNAEVLATPIAGPSLSAREAYQMVEAAGARLAIPVHYEHFLADPALFAAQCRIAEVVVLTDGESVEI